MDAGRAALSLFFLAILLVKIAEGWLGLEAWPLTNVSMFFERRRPEELPLRASLYGKRADGTEVELAPRDVWLTPDEFNRKLRDSSDLSGACGDVARAYNRRVRRPGARLTEAWGVLTEVARPGGSRAPQEMRYPCPLERSPAGPGGPPP